MKFLAFNVRPDEREHFEETAARLGADIVLRDDTPSLGNADAVKGMDGLSIITQPVSAALLEAWAARGIRAVSTRTVGFDHIDLAAATRLGIAVSNVSYTPHTVAEYTVMAMLMCLRNMKLIMRRFDAGDFGLRGVRGRELGRCTVGVVGTGRIGAWVVHLLKPFGCRVLANDVRENPEVQGLAEYVSREELFRQSDIITFHTPAVPDTFHLVNRDTLASMKPGVILINMSRGTVVDTEALIEALESGRVGVRGPRCAGKRDGHLLPRFQGQARAAQGDEHPGLHAQCPAHPAHGLLYPRGRSRHGGIFPAEPRPRGAGKGRSEARQLSEARVLFSPSRRPLRGISGTGTGRRLEPSGGIYE